MTTEPARGRRELKLPCVSNFGRIKSQNGVKYLPRPNDAGRCYFLIHGIGQRPVYVLVHVLHNDPTLHQYFDGATVDHIDRNSSNDEASNLRWLSGSDQLKNRNHLGHTGFEVVAVNNQTGEARVFRSGRDAELALNLNAGAVCRCCNGEYEESRGWKFSYGNQEDIEDEKWENVAGCNWRVSSHGRVQKGLGKPKQFPKARKTGYVYVSIPGVGAKAVHELVLLTFGPARPSPSHTPDHLNNVRGDNRLSNLVWASKSAQAIRRRPHTKERMRKWCAAREIGKPEWRLFRGYSQAAKELGCNRSQVNSCLSSKSRLKTTPGHNNVRFEFKEIEKDDNQDLPGEVWKPIVAADWDADGRYGAVFKHSSNPAAHSVLGSHIETYGSTYGLSS